MLGVRISSVRRWLLPLAAVCCLLLSLKSLDLLPAKFDLGFGRERPDLNVLVITLDTTRADAIGTYGGRAVTPGVDHLASTGVVFEQASTVAPLTLPAHSSLFTALFPPRHHIHENGQVFDEGFVTLAERLRAEGFQTGAFTSSFVLDREWGLDQGFDVYGDLRDSASALDPQPLRRSADRVVDEALGWLQGVGGRRFFAWLHFYDAHAPAQAPAEFASPNGQDSYHGAIGFVDLQLSRVMTFLIERGLLDRTIVVVVGDHGESLGEHGEPLHGLFVYESVIRVPLVIRAPFHGMQGRRVADPVRIVDIVPTVLDLMGETAASGIDGKTLVPLMSGALKELKLDAYSESRYGFDRFGWSPLMALRQGRWKLIQAPRPELYDLESDPTETTNLYSHRAGLASALMRRLEEIGRPVDAGRPADVPAIDPARTRLEALGYVSGPVSRSPIDASALLVDPKDRVEIYRQFTARLKSSGVLP